MLETLLFFLNNALLLLFGILSSAAFAGIRHTRKNTMVFLGLFGFSGLLQLLLYFLASEEAVWKLYPLVTHLPLFLALWLGYRKYFISAIAAVCTAYMCCQPARWLGILTLSLTDSAVAEYIVRVLVLLLCGFLNMKVFSPCLSQIFRKERKSVLIFGMTPIIYYFYDYITSVYAKDWMLNNPVTAEFLNFFLSVSFVVFCYIYFQEYEQKSDAERKEQILRITAEQQSNEVEAIRRSGQEIQLLRHDMRHILSSLAVCIEDGNKEKALEIISTYCDHIDGTKPAHFCQFDTVNYVLSDFSARCRAEEVSFRSTVELSELALDEMMFSLILSNALDNALNAQLSLPKHRRQVQLMLKNANGKLLMSVKNPVSKPPFFADGLPVTDRENHGYGSQSIRYLTERLGGNCLFSFQGGLFTVRVIL